MSTITRHDVVIVGGGMVGLSLALALSNSGLTLALIDPQQKAEPVQALQSGNAGAEFEPRVSALTARMSESNSSRLFDARVSAPTAQTSVSNSSRLFDARVSALTAQMSASNASGLFDARVSAATAQMSESNSSRLFDARVSALTAQTSESNASMLFDARVSALTPASQKFLDTLGVWEPLSQLRVCAYNDMHVWDADGTGAIHFSAAEIHADCLGYIVENSLVSAVLAEALAGTGSVTFYQPDSLLSFTRLTDDKGQHITQLTLGNGQTLQCKLLIGADGANSRVRTQAGFVTREWDYGQQALVTTVKTELPHQFTAWQRFMTSGPLAFLPLMQPGSDSQHYCSIVWSCIPELAEELLALDDAGFALRLERAFEARLGRIESVASRHAFPLRQHHATDYVQAGIALVGDAAHAIHPLAGQGVNLGFADVLALAETIQAAVARREAFASLQVLSRYQRSRQSHNLGMMVVMESFKRTFGSDNLALRWLRNTGLRAADQSTFLKQSLMKKAMGL